MITEDSEYYISLVDKVEADFDRIELNYEKCYTIGKMLSNSITCYREIVKERERQSMP